MTAVVLVTDNTTPHLSASDKRYADALVTRGVAVSAAPWNGGAEPFYAADAVVLRSNWDYHRTPERFAAWLDDLEGRGVRLFNPPALVRWNLDKRYLLDLAARGVRLPQTRVVPDTAATITHVLDAFGWEQAVVKPTVGASGHGVRLVRREDLAAHTDGAAGSLVIVQEYMPELATGGELSCVFFNGEYSHAIMKRPQAGEFRINSQYGGVASRFDPPAGVREQAAAALATLDAAPLYARVDGVLRGNDLVLMELELNEPALGFQFAPEAADRFAAATLRRLREAA